MLAADSLLFEQPTAPLFVFAFPWPSRSQVGLAIDGRLGMLGNENITAS